MNGRNAGEGGDMKVWKGEKGLCVDKGMAEIWFTAAIRTYQRCKEMKPPCVYYLTRKVCGGILLWVHNKKSEE